MKYKLNEEFRNVKPYEIDKKTLDFAATKVKDVIPYQDKINSYLYDIEVEGNHNFVVNDGVVIHNCISWEKIKHAVDHGFADEDPNQLENYVGDYVFNAKSGTKEIRLDQPVEIMEGGTGFMLIQRKAFEKFADTFPEYSYKPDHIRHENFDGSREIMQYFHCEIDPKSKRYLSEDYWFCRKLQEAGVKIWLLPWLELKHQGAYIFGGSLNSLAQIGQNPTADMNVLNKYKKQKK